MATHTLSKEKQHEVPSISALLNCKQTDNHDYLPTPVTPAGSGYGSFAAQNRENSATTDATASTAGSNAGAPPDKPYLCHVCRQAFSRPHNLKSHLTTHSSERPFECDVCNQHFRRHHDLKRHQKLHTGERPFVCKFCRRPFARLDALNRHQRAEGGTACSAMRSPTSSPKPAIPQLQIPLPALRRQSDPIVASWSPLTLSATAASALQSPRHFLPSPVTVSPRSSLPDARPWSAHIAHKLRALPTPAPLAITSSTQSTLDSLENENRSLRLELARLRNQQPTADDIQSYKARLHDLQVENKVLRSLIKNGDNGDHDVTPSRAKQKKPSEQSEQGQGTEI